MSPLWSIALTALSLTTMWLAGQHKWYAWLLGLISQAVWITYAVATQQYAFTLSAVLHAAVYWRNLQAWRALHQGERMAA